MDGTTMMAYQLYQELFGKRSPSEHFSKRDILRLEVLAGTELDTVIAKMQEFQKVAKDYLSSNEFSTSHH